MIEVDDWINTLIASDKSSKTINAYVWQVNRMLNDIGKPPAEITRADLFAFVAARRQGSWGNSAIKLSVCAVKSFFRCYYRDQATPADDLPIVRPKLRRQRTLNATQAFAVLASCDTGRPRGQRDLAMLCLLLDTGLRAAELCNLKVSEVDLEQRSLRTKVKGGEEGDGVFSAYTASQMNTWLALRAEIALPDVTQFFVGVGGLKPGTKLTPYGLRCIFRKIVKEAGLEKFAPHDMRRTFATLCIRYGAPTRLVQVAGRWDSLELLERYTAAIQPSDIDPYLPVNRLMDL